MTDFESIEPPAIQTDCTPQQILTGPPIDPLDRVKIYSADQFEDFIKEWAYFFLQKISGKYERVMRFGGSGDQGRDIVAYAQLQPAPVCDYFQCKHYDHPLSVSDVLPELAKLCYFTFVGTIPVPKEYRFVAPYDVSADLGRLLESPDELRNELVRKWTATSKNSIKRRIISGQDVTLDNGLLQHVRDFDFSRVGCKPIHEVIDEHRRTVRYAPRFGGGLTKSLPSDQPPPAEIAPQETRYVEQLLEAYRDNTNDAALELTGLPSLEKLFRHFQRSRERFYCAETLREFAKDSLPDGTTFTAVQDQVFDAVVDVVESDHACGLTRLDATTRTAQSIHVANHPLGSYVKPKSLQGICHQLANDDRLKWVP